MVWPRLGSLVPGPIEPSTQRMRPSRCFCRLDPLAGDLARPCGELFDAVVDAVVGEVRPVGAEGVGFDGVDADREVGVVDVRDDIRAGGVEDLVAALELLEVVLERQVPPLQHGAHRAVGDDDPVVHRIQQRLRADGTGDGINIKRKTRHLNRLRAGAETLRCVSVYYDAGVAFLRPSSHDTGPARRAGAALS